MKHTLTLFTALQLAPLAAATAEDVRKGGTWPPERKGQRVDFPATPVLQIG